MSIVYLMEQNATVSKEGGRLVVKTEGKVSHTIHLFKLEQVVLFGNIFLTPAAIHYLLREGIDTAFMTRQGLYLGRLQGIKATSKNVIPAKARFRVATTRIQNFLKSMDSCFRRSDEFGIIRGSFNCMAEGDGFIWGVVEDVLTFPGKRAARVIED